MVKIDLYKDDKRVLSINGKIVNENFFFENITYNVMSQTLIREDASYRYTIDFMKSNAQILVKDYNFVLDLKIDIKKFLQEDNLIIIEYVIESEKSIKNKIEIKY